MKIDIIKNGKLMDYYYRRVGQCKHCGDCCRRRISCNDLIVTTSLGNLMDNEGSFSQYDDDTVLIRFLGVQWLFPPCIVNEAQECTNLRDSKCSKWMEQMFHPLCYFWPVHPDNLSEFPRCSFSFDKISYNYP